MRKTVVEIVVVGDEILASPARDTNSAFLADALGAAGYPVSFISSVGDRIESIAGVFLTAAGRADVILATGGLGPTPDDVTVGAAAKAANVELEFDGEVFRRIEALFRRRNRPMSGSNRKQAMIPAGAVPLVNEIGTAPGICLELNGAVLYLMPGVPAEMQKLFSDTVLPEIKERFAPSDFSIATLNVTGVSESGLYDSIRDIPGVDEAVSFYPGPEGIELRIVTADGGPKKAREICENIAGRLGDRVFSSAGETLEAVVGGMLMERGLTVSVAESCTGGLIAHRLTNVPGSSRYLLAGVVAYSNESKQRLLGVDGDLIGEHGAVSAEVAAAMARGIRERTGADIGISTTGIAGPGGGSIEKPVGLMYGGIATGEEVETKKLQFMEDRIINKCRMSQAMIDILRKYVNDKFQ